MVVTSRPTTSETEVMQERTACLVDHDGAGAAERLAAAKFGAGQAHLIAEKPEQRKVGIAIPVLFLAINLQLDHDRFSLFLSY